MNSPVQGKVRAIRNHVLVTEMKFDQRITAGGIVILNDNGKTEGIRPRWGRVYDVGPEQKDVEVGQWVMVAHGRWTRGLDIEDGETEHHRTIRKIDPDDILMVSDGPDRPLDQTWSSAIHVQKQSRD
jgi:hypothetical protein